MRGKISLGRAHFSRQFPGWAGPEEIDDVAIAVMPLGAAGRYNDLQVQNLSATAAAVVVGADAPDNQQRWVAWMSCFHDDTNLTSHIWLCLLNREGAEVAIVGGADVTAQRRISIRRPIIIPEGWHVRAKLATAPAAGKKLRLVYYYVDMPIGEYVAPL